MFCSSKDRLAILRSLPPKSKVLLDAVAADLSQLEFTMRAETLTEFTLRLAEIDPALSANLTAGIPDLVRALPRNHDDPAKLHPALPSSHLDEPPLLNKLKWFVRPRDREDVVADLRDDANQMRESGCSQTQISLYVLWHLLICLAQYFRSSLSPRRSPRDPS